MGAIRVHGKKILTDGVHRLETKRILFALAPVRPLPRHNAEETRADTGDRHAHENDVMYDAT